MESLFTAFNSAAIVSWVVLIFFKNSKIAQILLYKHWYLVLLAVSYCIFIVWGMSENFGGEGGMDSLESLRIAFVNDKVLLAAWIHYLVFDLFVGIWISQKAEEHNMNPILRGVILLFTFFFGPVGFLLFKASTLNK